MREEDELARMQVLNTKLKALNAQTAAMLANAKSAGKERSALARVHERHPMIEEDKVALVSARAALVEQLTTPLRAEDRLRVQAELSVLNAKIKAVNTTAAAQLKAAADRRKANGLAEAQANAARARDKTPGDNLDFDHATAAEVDAWIAEVLQDSLIKVRRTRGGLTFEGVPEKWSVVLHRLRAGLHAAVRGEELPDNVPEEAPPKTKKR